MRVQQRGIHLASPARTAEFVTLTVRIIALALLHVAPRVLQRSTRGVWGKNSGNCGVELALGKL